MKKRNGKKQFGGPLRSLAMARRGKDDVQRKQKKM